MSSFQHKFFAAFLVGVVAVATGLVGCAGNGAGLNSDGQPIGSGSSSSGGSGGSSSGGTVTADFESIQGERIHADLFALPQRCERAPRADARCGAQLQPPRRRSQ